MGIARELSQVLQKNNRNIITAMHLIKVAKTRLQAMREKEWESLMDEISKFCSSNKLVMLARYGSGMCTTRKRKA